MTFRAFRSKMLRSGGAPLVLGDFFRSHGRMHRNFELTAVFISSIERLQQQVDPVLHSRAQRGAGLLVRRSDRCGFANSVESDRRQIPVTAASTVRRKCPRTRR